MVTKNRDKIKYLNCIQKGLLLIIFSIFIIPIVTAGNYTGNSSTCKSCHEEQYALWTNSTHTSKLITRDDAIARGYPNPPGGYSWDNVSFAIGGKWKIRYVNNTGYIITTGGKNQFNVDDQIWTDYNPNQSKPYICGNCHNTGYLSNVTDTVKEPFRTLRAQGQLADGVYDNSSTPGFTGYWSENSIGCEACHGQGEDHVNNPTNSNIRNASVVRNSPGICGNCHSRPNTGEYEDLKPYPYGVNDTLLSDTLYDSSPMPTVDYSKVGGHHEQWEDWKASVHANQSVNCVSCHGGHSISDSAYAGGPTGKTRFTNGSVYPATVNKTCTDCHSVAQPKHGYYTENTECISCHMPVNRKSANKMDLRSHWFDVNALKDNKNGNPHASTNFGTLQNVNESCVTCHSSANLSKPIDTASAGMHKDVNKSEGIGLLNSSDCKTCHNSASASAIQNRTCENCHIDQVITSPKVDEHTNKSTDVTVTANCALCHNNSINKFKLSSNASVSHYGTVNSLINTSNCIDCHNGVYTENASWGSPVNISTSLKRTHTETQTSQCDQCHNDGKVPTLAAVTFHNASVEIALPPPVPQSIGLRDTGINNLVTTGTDQSACRGCHQTSGTNINGGYNNTVGGVPTRHHSLLPRGVINPKTGVAFNCQSCHPSTPGIGSGILIDRSCVMCHNGTDFYGNSIGATVGNFSRPHHVNTSYASSNIGNPAANRTCKFCHGGFVDNYNDGHYKPDYATDFMITPYATFKVNDSANNKLWGGCLSCHQAATGIDSNHDTHHKEILGMGRFGGQTIYQNASTPFDLTGAPGGRSCYVCHVVQTTGTSIGSPLRLNITNPFTGENLINAMELRNSTLEAAGVFEPGTTNISINGTGCQKCHSVASIHNIQNNYVQNGQQGLGHINNDLDCNGCHNSWVPASDYVPGALVPTVDSVSPAVIAVGTAATLTITGSNFVNGPYTSVVTVDGVTYTPSSITDAQIVVDIPALSAGAHQLQLVKGGDTPGKLYTLIVAPNLKITTVTLGNGVIITITGSNFGTKPAEDAEYYVSVNNAGNQIRSTSIITWSSTQIKARFSAAAIGDWVTVMTQDAGEVKAQIT